MRAERAGRIGSGTPSKNVDCRRAGGHASFLGQGGRQVGSHAPPIKRFEPLYNSALIRMSFIEGSDQR
jgi:hypothetical protein